MQTYSWRPTTRLRKRRLGFKVLVWLALFYLVVAALHGVVPSLWSQYFGERHENGPFRVLIFTPVIAAALAVLILHGLRLHFVRHSILKSPVTRATWPAWSRRGPPAALLEA